MQFIRILKLLLIIFLFNNFHLAISFAQTCTANVSPTSDCPGGSLAITANNTNITNTKIIGDASAIPTYGINSSSTSNATNLSVENRGTINGGYALYFKADVTDTGTLNNTNTTKTITSITNSGIWFALANFTILSEFLIDIIIFNFIFFLFRLIIFSIIISFISSINI